MTPAARLQAAIELLDEIIAAAREGGAAADTLIARYFKTRRYAGSKDRRAVRELVYPRRPPGGRAPGSGRAAMLGLAEDDPELLACSTGRRTARQPSQGDEPAAEAGIAPRWLLEALRSAARTRPSCRPCSNARRSTCASTG